MIKAYHNRNKAVADGGISFYVDHFVTARVAKHVIGMECMADKISPTFI